jgi:hypothetical protein
VLTFTDTRASSAARFGAAAMLSAVMLVFASAMTRTSAQAADVVTGGCIGGWRGYNCATGWAPAVDPFIRIVPQPLGRAEQARAIERDHKWLARCRPIVAQDTFGVSRYHYAAPGCEFGVGEY